MIPLGDKFGRGIGMSTKNSVHMGVPLVPLGGKTKSGHEREQEKQSNSIHKMKTSLQKIPVLGKRNEWSTGYLLVQQGVGELRIFLSPIFNL
jgi:hypothetical protein